MKKSSEELLKKYKSNITVYNKRELRSLFVNGSKQVELKRFEQTHFEELADLIESEMRERFPTEAKKLFGGLSKKPRLFLNEILFRLKGNFDITDNKHKSKVKNGAGVFKGDRLVDVYISYKKTKETWFGIYISQLNAKEPISVSCKFRMPKENKEYTELWTEERLEDIWTQVRSFMMQI